jgi:hypothetical protein
VKVGNISDGFRFLLLLKEIIASARLCISSVRGQQQRVVTLNVLESGEDFA